MTMTVNPTLHSSHYDYDPKQKIIEACGGMEKINELSLSGKQVLVGVHMRPQKSAKGLMRTHEEVREDEFQGATGLILKLGPLAFYEEELAWENECPPQAGDWVWFRPMYGYSKQINGHPCRIYESKQILGKLPNPDSML